VTASLVTPRHKWGEPVSIHPQDADDGIERTLRTCNVCGIIKTTVHPPRGIPFREWRTKDGMVAQITATPPCLGGQHHDD
jgi:hypothetical protein